MCIICVEFEQGKLKLGEAVRNYGEMKSTLTPEHQREMEEMLFNNFPYYPPDYDDYDDFDDDYWEVTGFGD